MAKTFKLGTSSCSEEDTKLREGSWGHVFRALDCVRLGHIGTALNYMGGAKRIATDSFFGGFFIILFLLLVVCSSAAHSQSNTGCLQRQEDT